MPPPEQYGRGQAKGCNLTHAIFDTLGQAIVTGHYDERSFPTEAEIASTHGVSRSVTREAVKMLTAKGLVSARPRRGTIVEPTSAWNLFDPDVLRWMLERKFSFDLLRHFNQLRIAIEPTAAALAAQFHEPSDLERIREGVTRMVAAEAGEGDSLEADIAFHIAIIEASRNPFYAQFRSLISTALRTSIRVTNTIRGGVANAADHVAVAEAIAARDAGAAHDAMNRLISEVLLLIGDGQEPSGEDGVTPS